MRLIFAGLALAAMVYTGIAAEVGALVLLFGVPVVLLGGAFWLIFGKAGKERTAFWTKGGRQ